MRCWLRDDVRSPAFNDALQEESCTFCLQEMSGKFEESVASGKLSGKLQFPFESRRSGVAAQLDVMPLRVTPLAVALSILVSVFVSQSDEYSASDDLQIQPKTPVVNVVQIIL